MQVTLDLTVSAATVKERWTRKAADAFIDAAVGQTGLTPFAHRAVVDLPDRLIFFQMIAESHICGHLMREYGLGWVDVFSCKPVDPLEVGKLVQWHLALPGDSVKVRTLARGILPEGGTDGAHDQGARTQGQAH